MRGMSQNPQFSKLQVAVIAPNIPAIYEAHFGIPMAGALVNCVNIRLNASTIAFLLDHSSAEVVMVDQEFFTLADKSLKIIADKKKNAFRVSSTSNRHRWPKLRSQITSKCSKVLSNTRIPRDRRSCI
ncbi:putative acid--thiol ligase [Dioscorea sansibarensis]